MVDEDVNDSRKVVLVVDDEPIVRMLAADLFSEIGCEVFEASNGAEALSILERRPDIGLLFSDCRMPGMSGPELAAIAAERRPSLQIILVSGHPNVQTTRWPLIWKPFDQNSLKRAIGAG